MSLLLLIIHLVISVGYSHPGSVTASAGKEFNQWEDLIQKNQKIPSLVWFSLHNTVHVF